MSYYNIIYNGTSARDLGVLIVRRPSSPAPLPKTTSYNIAGRDGSLFESWGLFEDVPVYVEMNFMAPLNEWENEARKIRQWLLNREGSRALFLSDDAAFFRRVKNVDAGEIERTSRRIGTLTPIFTCDPYMYAAAGQNAYAPAAVELNPYMKSHPIYQITGEGMCTLTVNGNEMTADIGQNLTIDTDRMIAYRNDGTLMNTAITGEYEDLYLLSGQNSIEISDGFTMTVIPQWRTL